MLPCAQFIELYCRRQAALSYAVVLACKSHCTEHTTRPKGQPVLYYITQVSARCFPQKLEQPQMLQRLIWTQKAEVFLEITVMDRGNLFWPRSSSMMKNKMSTLKAHSSQKSAAYSCTRILPVLRNAQVLQGKQRCLYSPPAPFSNLSITATIKIFLHWSYCWFYSEVMITGLLLQ